MTEPSEQHGVYGAPPREVAETPAGAIRFSPLVPGAADLEAVAPGSMTSMTLLAPPGTIERRYALALALRALAPNGRLTAAAPKDKGGSRLRKDLEAFGCVVNEDGRRHHRICITRRPDAPTGLDEALAEGAPRLSPTLGLWTQPGVFSWDRVDPGSALLLKTLPPLAGAGADLGAGVGVLAHAVLASLKVERLTLIDIDRRAVEAARRNVADPRVDIRWADARQSGLEPGSLDFVVMNPPFHDGGAEDKSLGQAFIRQAASLLRKGGVLWLVANRHLPYEAVLADAFRTATPRADAGGFKVIEAVK
ncbi:class I SAM-dependent methyltransferase [Caulobacter mirabilis]|uniref:Methyltransferase n=1 Tax=Caulobacter mirabilis TaxID=69666 RepID=A0A2D2ASD4_9CAUL|nr:class I SAM-dependent methyltransferase [Caulobacter mirabilis]ATQ40920.1 methyltransferase [Caulobacter mirabilis]